LIKEVDNKDIKEELIGDIKYKEENQENDKHDNYLIKEVDNKDIKEELIGDIKYKKELDHLKLKNKFNKYIISIILLVIFILVSFKDFPKSKYPSRLESLKRMKKYMKQCFKGLLINNNTNYQFNSSLTKITAVIPVYNCKNTIKAAVRSIQNQNMSDIEIFLVNDCSKDETPKIIEEMAKEDLRIKIINNKKNMGTLYSRSIGILNAKGKYIMNLDNDDLFMDSEVFNDLYNEAQDTNYDIIGFRAIEANNYDPLLPETSNGFFHNLEDGLKVFQPELTYFPYTKNGKVYPNDYHVWGRIVKTDVYVKSINNLGVNALGEDRISQFLVWNEDTAATVSLFKYAQSYKFIHRFGIFHYMSKTTATNTRPDIENIYSDIFVLDMMFDFSDNNTKCKKFIVDRALEISTDRKLQIYCEKTALLIKAVLKKMCECEYISEEDKNKLKESYNITNINLEL
jgi:glycosyltransferase involved in cell wall biosynthesis